MKSLALSFTILIALGASAHANDLNEARKHFESAQTHFAVGEFGPAGDEYLAAYKLKPDSALLYNAAQAYRLAGNQEKALILYKNYVQFYPHESNIDEVHTQIAKLKDAIAAAEKAKTSPPTDTAQPKPMPAVPEATPAPTAPAPETAPPGSKATTNTVAETAPPASALKESTPIYKKWWLWTIVGGVVVAGAVTAAVLLTTSSGTWNNAPGVGPGQSMALGVRW
jgi:tetratricopeptide (TPR) repeat protein